jgi:hypothetical protein
VKIFLWKSLNGALPGMQILADRHIKVNPQCPVSQLGHEDARHLFFTCARAQLVWDELGLREYVENMLQVHGSGF